MKRTRLWFCSITVLFILFSAGFARPLTSYDADEGNAARPQEPRKPYPYDEEEVS